MRLRDEALFSTYAVTGLRRTEALRLNVSDYDPAEMTLSVKGGKGRRVRTIPVVRQLGLLLNKLHGVCGSSEVRAGRKLFPGRLPGRGLTPRQAHARFEHWKTIAGLRPDLTIHSFRAGFATALHRTTGDVLLVSCALGHRDLRPTMRYVQLSQPQIRKAVEGTFGEDVGR